MTNRKKDRERKKIRKKERN